MSSYFDEASLVMIPSGYKDQKVYSVKPLDGSGDLTSSRASSATRVASNGLIEKVRTNLALYSEQFNDAYWVKSNVSVTSNTTANPVNGASTADTLTRTGGGSGFLSKQIAQTGIVTFSIYAKSGSTNFVRLNTYDGSADRGATYNLTTGAITSPYGSPLFTTSQALSNGWYRISISVNAASYADCQVQIDSLNSVIIFGAQLETGDIATDYIATTSAAVSVGPVSGLPRLDYLNSTCPRLLLEPQRSSLLLFSEQMNNAAWNKSSVTITANNIVSPDGYTNADLATATAGGELNQGLTLSTSTAYTFSFYVKKGTAADAKYRVYNFDAGVNVVAPTSYISQTNTSTWVRVSVSFTSSATGTNYGIYLLDQASAGTMYFWGAQLEAGAYATSYIPTLGTSVTRVADAASKTGISSLIGQTEGVLFAEIDLRNAPINDSYLMLRNAAVTNYLAINWRSGIIRFETVNAGVLQTAINFSVSTPQTLKVAVAYKLNDFVMYINGTQVGTDTSATVPTCDILDLNFNGPSFNAFGIAQALIFKTRLTNAQLAELTTL